MCSRKVDVIQDERHGKALKHWKRAVCLTGALISAVACSTAQAVPTLPPGFSTQVVVNNIPAVVAFDFATGDRIFTASKDGRVRVVVGGVVQPRLFADYRTLVNNQRDRGLLGIAVHPEFPTQPYVYLLMTYDPPELVNLSGPAGRDGTGNRVARLVRLEADPGENYNVARGANANGLIVDPTWETVLLGTNSTFENIGDPAADRQTPFPSCDNNGSPIIDCLPADEITHTIGTVKFGVDGSLYVSNGDGSGAVGGVSPYTLRSQDLDSLAGKILRIHPITGEAYADNPWFDGDFDANRSKVWNYGLRNPFRFTFNKDNGDIWIGDVGWGLWEEMNTGNGKNFGWPCYEGAAGYSAGQPAYSFEPACQALNAGGLFNQITAPVYAVDHNGSSSSVQMGDFYTGPAWPATYQGALFHSDINRQVIEYMEFDSAGNFVANHPFATNATGISQISAGPDTNLYYTDLYANEIRRIIYTAGGNTPPTPVFTATPLSGPAPLTLTVDGTASFDADAHSMTFTWFFGDGSTATGPTAQHVYPNAGSYLLSLQVTDSQNATSQVTETIVVGNSAPSATILSIDDGAGGTNWQIGDSVVFSGIGSDPEDGTLTGDSLEWTATVQHNNHIHLDYYNGTGDGGQFIYLDHEDNSYLNLCLTVTDSGGLTDTTCQDIFPDEVDVTINSVPQGLTLTYESTTDTTPFTVSTPIGATRSVIAAPTQGNYSFSNWSDGGSNSHTITIPANNATYTATYTNNSSNIPCGAPNYNPATDQGTFGWYDCGTGRWTVNTSDGGSTVRVTNAGTVESNLAFTATGPDNYEPQFDDNLDFSDPTAIDYVLHTKNGNFDGFWFDLAGGAEVCIGLGAASGSQIFLGPQAIAYTMPIDPDTLTSCSGYGSNSLPVITPIANQINAEGATVSLQVVATDADLDPITYTASNLPPGLNISSSGLISGAIANGAVGSYVVSVGANDGTGTTNAAFQWTVEPTGSLNICGQPDFNSATQQGTFIWSDCATGRYFMHGRDGGSSVRVTHAGHIDSSAPYANTGTINYEPQYDDVFNTSTAGRIDYAMHTKNGAFDGLWFDVAAGESVCIGLDQAAGTTAYIGAQASPVTLPIDPVTLATCTSPLNPVSTDYCFSPDLNPQVDDGLYIWKDCGATPETWHIRTAAGGSSSLFRFHGVLTTRTGAQFQSATPYSYEGNDLLTPLNPTTRLTFIHRMINNGVDGVDFEIPSNSDVCLEMTFIQPGSQIYVGENRIPVTAPFDIETLGACQ